MKFLVYVIDDNESMRKLMKRALDIRFDVKVFSDVETALLEIAQNPPHAIVSDIMMPGMDGYELCAHLKSHDRFSSIPVILVSAKSGSLSRATGFQLGAVGFVEKPFDSNELLVLTESIIQFVGQVQKIDYQNKYHYYKL